jgi:hypothetical protein
MTEKLKALIENATLYDWSKHKDMLFDFLYIIPKEEKYDGFWGQNGYNQMFILAQQQESEDVYMVTDFADSFVFMHPRNTHIDIPTDYQCVRIWFDCPIKIEPPASTVICHNPNDFRTE